ncbi:beta-lactamase family protein [Pseudoalteromonas sp. SG44-1]|uniref:serine hydrolase domain-containing protein n=1 Tax=unclassified Pseudoalteromonas TaxID=194690 RepID=UPI001601C73A|nr:MULTISPECIES: serine hydrolase domain-containing protein [unclassified Pseudoalteromonas]MBB1418668.1 beta-lactamase family protein [Pseudoalteromonas sp. SG44-1]MBB1481409.1 beta-lactamase family protein [Pseudoalteromonas sp. SG41-2]
MMLVKNKKTLTLMRIAAFIVTIMSIYFFAPWQFALYYLQPLPATIKEQTQEAIEQGVDGIIVYIHRQGQQPEFFANGWHNRDQKIPAYPSALFKIGSIRKLYDAAALTKLSAAGRIDVDKTLADYLPSLIGRIENADKITLRMMVKHRSGIPNYTDTDHFDWSITYPDPLALVLDTPADFSPNADYGYSNTNYLLLRKIMSNVLGYDHNQFIKNEILTPLGLTNTFESVNEINLALLMSGYYVGYENDFKALDQGYVATAQDVGDFIVALNNGTFFSEQEQALYASLYKYEHTGWVLGYSSIARYYKDIDTVVVQFINTNGNDTVLLTEIIYNRIIDILTAQQ